MTPSRPKIFSCPGCSLRVSGLESSCPRCGKEFGPDVRLECPFCSTLVPPNSDRCPSCQVDYFEFVEKAEEQLWEKALDKIVQEIEDLKTEVDTEQSTPKADEAPPPEPSVVEETLEAICPVCKKGVRISDQACPSCGTIFDSGEDERLGEEAEEACCPICGEIVSMNMTACPFCGAEFETEEEESVPEVPEPEPVKVVVKPRIVRKPGVVEARRGLVTASPEVKARAGRGLSNGVGVSNGAGIINGKSKINGVGAINGRGQINGIHFVNGRGAVNGKDLVNGTGILNGSGARRRYPFGSGDKVPFYIRWQFIAILVAIAILIPSFLHFVNIGDEGPYSIDGDFRDWEDKTMFTAVSISTDHGTEVVEWSVDDYQNTVYLYVRTFENLMANPEAERIVLFIDHDNSPDTGYAVGGIGADFMIEISGWNGTVRSSILMEFESDDDQLDWSQWSSARYAKSTVIQNQLEAMADLPVQLNSSARFILTAQDEQSVTCISHPVVTDGGLLIVEQRPASGVSADEILQSGQSTSFVRLRFTCQGEGGTVESVTPTLTGLTSFESIGQFTLEVGDEYEVDLRVDSSGLADGQFVSASFTEQGITSSFAYVRIVGDPVRAYASAPPQNITIDGAFADWENRTVTDLDSMPVGNPNIDIDEVGTNTTDENAYFFVSVDGELCAGVYVPKICAIPVSSGGGTIVPVRRTAEDFIRIYIDADRSSASGRVTSVGSMTIGADYMIETRGLCCEIVSVDAYQYIAGAWARVSVPVDAAKDASRMEIGVPSDAIGDPESFEFLIETTDWCGNTDYASNETLLLSARTWSIHSGVSQYATSMSYQRKLFHDGTNFWSFYFDGSNTVCEYSDDGGESWTSRNSVFTNSGVREVSIWYDSGNNVVYAVGDTASATRNIYIQKGTVNSGSKTITWAVSDSTYTASTQNSAGKNTYICRDTNGYLWILSLDLVQTNPQVKYNLVALKSSSANSITSWASTGSMLASGGTQDPDVCGSIVPAGTGSDVWAIFAYEGKVYSKKYASAAWESSAQGIYTTSGTQQENTVNAPPSVVVDSDHVVHVVYGDKTENGGYSKPKVYYTHNETDDTAWVAATDLDSSLPSNQGDKYPSISIDTSTGDLYAFWVRTDADNNPVTVMGKTYSGGSWSSLSFGSQTSYVKHYLTSVYSASSDSYICWLWTENVTGDIEVFFDVIPEFDDIVVPVLTMLAVFMVFFGRKRKQKDDEIAEDLML